MAIVAYPTVPLSQSSTFQKDQRVYESKFGDGYSQRVGAGINSKYWAGQVRHENITQTDLNTLLTFWDSVGLAGIFTMVLPINSTSYKWRFTGPFTIQALAGNIYTVGAPIEQDFSLVV